MKKKPAVKKKKGSSSFPKVKKELSEFLLSEEGKMSKKKIAKMGIALGAMALFMKPEESGAHHSQGLGQPASHTSGAMGGRGGHSSHSSHSSHTSHGSHSSHGSGGWC